MFNAFSKLISIITNITFLLKTKFTLKSFQSSHNVSGKLDSDYSTQSKSFYTTIFTTFSTDGLLSFMKTYSINF